MIGYPLLAYIKGCPGTYYVTASHVKWKIAVSRWQTSATGQGKDSSCHLLSKKAFSWRIRNFYNNAEAFSRSTISTILPAVNYIPLESADFSKGDNAPVKVNRTGENPMSLLSPVYEWKYTLASSKMSEQVSDGASEWQAWTDSSCLWFWRSPHMTAVVSDFWSNKCILKRLISFCMILSEVSIK